MGSMGGPPAPGIPPEILIPNICFPVGLGFLGLLLIATFLPWAGGYGGSVSGLKSGFGGFLFVFCLLLGTLGGLSYLFKSQQPLVSALSAGFGTYVLWYLIGVLVQFGKLGGASAGVWVGLVSALFLGAGFTVASVFRPAPWPYADSLGLAPFLKRHAVLLLAHAVAVVLGIITLILSLMA
jgi:hypothetical protein